MQNIIKIRRSGGEWRCIFTKPLISTTFFNTEVNTIIVIAFIPFTVHVGDGKCVICDSYVRPCTLVRICDECNYGSYQGRCVICGGPGVSDAYYCKECTVQEKDVRLFPSSFIV